MSTQTMDAPTSELRIPKDYQERVQLMETQAQEAYGRHTDWIAFYREILGPDGLLRKCFGSRAELALFRREPVYDTIQQMVAKLRERSCDTNELEPTRVITVRLPKSLHETLKAEAHLHETSMNQLCITKLLALVSADHVPAG